MPHYDVVLLNPIGKYTGTGKMTLGIEADNKPLALYQGLKYARETLYWCYHIQGWKAPASEDYARCELRDLRLNCRLAPLDPEPALAALPEGVPYP